MSWEQFWDQAWKVGLPFVLVCLGFAGLYTRRIIVKPDYDEMLQIKDNEIKRLEIQNKELNDMVKTYGRFTERELRRLEAELKEARKK